MSKERKAERNEEWLRFGKRVRNDAGKDKGPGWEESEARDGRSDVDFAFEAAFACG